VTEAAAAVVTVEFGDFSPFDLFDSLHD